MFCFLFFRCLEKVFKKERNKNRDGNRCYDKLVTVERDRMMKFLALISYLLARVTLTLISSFAITGCFQKAVFQGFDVVVLNFELPSVLLYTLCELFKKLGCFMWK